MDRRKYYDFFSKFYDKFIELHSKDKQGLLRQEFTDIIISDSDRMVLDICCGTGSTTSFLEKKLNKKGTVVGLDFSEGMIRKAQLKCPKGVFVLGDISTLPFKNNVFDKVSCTFAFYEIKGDKVSNVLSEIKRVLKKEGGFYMMEHDVPHNFFIKILFYIRLLTMGISKALTILRNEEKLFSKHFNNVSRVISKSKKSKIWICREPL